MNEPKFSPNQEVYRLTSTGIDKDTVNARFYREYINPSPECNNGWRYELSRGGFSYDENELFADLKELTDFLWAEIEKFKGLDFFPTSEGERLVPLEKVRTQEKLKPNSKASNSPLETRSEIDPMIGKVVKLKGSSEYVTVTAKSKLVGGGFTVRRASGVTYTEFMRNFDKRSFNVGRKKVI